MTARDTITEALRARMHQPFGEVPTIAGELADVAMAAIRGMSHDELRELRPDIATLYDATKDTANTRADYILNLTDGRLRAIEQLHTPEGTNNPWCDHCGYAWPCPTTRALRGNP